MAGAQACTVVSTARATVVADLTRRASTAPHRACPASVSASPKLFVCNPRHTASLSVRTYSASSDTETVETFTRNFFCSDLDGADPDAPTQGFSPVLEAIQQAASGKPIILVEEASDGRYRGDMAMAARNASPEQMAFIVRHTCGMLSIQSLLF